MSKPEEKLREVLTSIVKELYPQASVKIKSISSDGANFSSTLFEVTIITPEDNVEIFAKVGNMGDNLQALSSHIFDTEKFFYTTIATAYEKIQNKHGIIDQRYSFPKYFKSSAVDGFQIIMMENLVSKGYVCYDRFKYIDWKYASKCVETLAKYHALSFALSKEHPEVFEKAGKVLDLPLLTGSEWTGLADGALAAVDEADRVKLSQLLEGSEGWSIMKDLTDPRKTSVIIHGDYRASNLVHKEINGELHVIPVDFQTARLGCPAADLIYFIVMGSDQHFRQKHYHQLVDHYYEQLSLAMRRLDLQPEKIYGREEFESDMKEKLPIGLGMAALTLPFVTVDPAHAPVFEAGQFVPLTNDLFAERFRELMQDFKQWGFI